MVFQIDSCLTDTLFTFNLTTQIGRVNFYTNVTSCILARTRCNAYNPITGELQQTNFVSPVFPNNPKSLSNAIQITTTGDLRIISFQPNVGVANLFCSPQTTLDQSGYGVTTC